jgi:predicted nucleotidyltransferase
MGIDQELIDEIVRRVLTVATPDRIILFGSAATGAMTEDSDIDLLIVEREPGDGWEASVRIRDAIGTIGYSCDVLVIDSDWFEDTKNVIGGIAFPANKYGRVIYAAA